jgi:hypothetical protein
MINRLKQQITHKEARVKNIKQKQSSRSILTATTLQSIPEEGLESFRQDKYREIQTLKDRLASTWQTTSLCLRGQEEDDPDLHPIQLTDGSLEREKADIRRNIAQQQGMGRQSSSINRTCSFTSSSRLNTSLQQRTSYFERESVARPAPLAHDSWTEFRHAASIGMEVQQAYHHQHPTSLYQPMKVRKLQDDCGLIEVLGIDPSYKPPPILSKKPGISITSLHFERLCLHFPSCFNPHPLPKIRQLSSKVLLSNGVYDEARSQRARRWHLCEV